MGLLLAAVLLASGCDGSGGEQPAADIAQTDPAKAAFVWPDDPTHPVIRLDIDGAAGWGSIDIELMPELAPSTVAQILKWTKEGYYDGTTFHRVIKGFMIQGGDPNSRDKNPSNDGKGGPGFTLNDEFSDAPFLRGVVAMGNTGYENSTGSQFFIMQADDPSLAGRYTVIGRVQAGMEVVDAIVEVEVDQSGRWGPRDRPIESVVMKRVRTIRSRLASRGR